MAFFSGVLVVSEAATPKAMVECALCGRRKGCAETLFTFLLFFIQELVGFVFNNHMCL